MHAEVNGIAGAEPQAVLSPLTGAAIFLVALIGAGAGSTDAMRRLCGSTERTSSATPARPR